LKEEVSFLKNEISFLKNEYETMKVQISHMKKNFFKEMMTKDSTIKSLKIRFTQCKEIIKDEFPPMHASKLDSVCLRF
jgi:hypothetical protein